MSYACACLYLSGGPAFVLIAFSYVAYHLVRDFRLARRESAKEKP